MKLKHLELVQLQLAYYRSTGLHTCRLLDLVAGQAVQTGVHSCTAGSNVQPLPFRDADLKGGSTQTAIQQTLGDGFYVVEVEVQIARQHQLD